MTAAILGSLLLLTAAPDPLSAAAKKELQALDGDWVVVRVETNTLKEAAKEDERAVLTIRGTKWSFPLTGEEMEVVALDPAATPKLIDLKDVRPGRKGKIGEGIYRRDGDTLTVVVYQGEDKKRPTTFDTPTEDRTVLFVMKRSKP